MSIASGHKVPWELHIKRNRRVGITVKRELAVSGVLAVPMLLA